VTQSRADLGASPVDEKDNPTPEWIESLRSRFPTEDFVDRALTRKLRLRHGGPHRTQPPEVIVERLRGFLNQRITPGFDLTEVRPLAGGSSKEQYRFRLRWEDESGAPRDEQFVLRLQPAASIVETHRMREFQAMRSLGSAVPVPEVFWVDAEGDELGQPALISQFCSGVTKPPVEGQITGPHQHFGPKYRALLAPQFVRDLARISTFDWRDSDLSSLDKPTEGTNESLLWGLNCWERIWEEDSIEACPLITVATKWLRDNAPPVDHVSIVHGDYRGGNFLFRPDDGTITAQLDWELVHLGDRHEDLAHTISSAFMEPDESGRLLISGLCPLEEFLEEYERLSRLPVDRKRLAYYTIYDDWKFSIMCLATTTRCAMGMKTHQDILLNWVSAAAPVLLRHLHQELRKQM